MRVVLALISLGALALGHGDAHDEVDPNSSYAEMHMASEVRNPLIPDESPDLTSASSQHHMDNFGSSLRSS